MVLSSPTNPSCLTALRSPFVTLCSPFTSFDCFLCVAAMASWAPRAVAKQRCSAASLDDGVSIRVRSGCLADGRGRVVPVCPDRELATCHR